MSVLSLLLVDVIQSLKQPWSIFESKHRLLLPIKRILQLQVEFPFTPFDTYKICCINLRSRYQLRYTTCCSYRKNSTIQDAHKQTYNVSHSVFIVQFIPETTGEKNNRNDFFILSREYKFNLLGLCEGSSLG